MRREKANSRFYDLDAYARQIYIRLLTSPQSDGKECIITIKELSKLLICSMSTIKKYIKILEDKEFIAIERGAGPNGTNKYILLFDEYIQVL